MEQTEVVKWDKDCLMSMLNNIHNVQINQRDHWKSDPTFKKNIIGLASDKMEIIFFEGIRGIQDVVS